MDESTATPESGQGSESPRETDAER